jgi:hypothetical protein
MVRSRGLWDGKPQLLFPFHQLLSLGSTALPFVISTEAQRSGEICGSAVLSWKWFLFEGLDCALA